jgi:hypothetical protein
MDGAPAPASLNLQAPIVSPQASLAASSQSDKRSASGGTPEFNFLCACCRPPATAAADLANCLQSSLDWDRVLKLARQHRVLPAVHPAVHGRSDVPASIQSALDSRFSNHRLRILRFSAELVSVMRQFEKHSITVLAHKGPILAQHLYGDSAMRDFGDLDFLVSTTDVPRARAALQELGYRPRFELTPRQEREYLRTGYEYVFGSTAEPNLIELQWQIVPRFYSIPFNMALLFQRSVECEIEGVRVRTLSNEDLMLVLCVHAAKHGWSQLGMIRDIATLARFELDWNWIESEAGRLGIQRIIAVSLELARTLLGLELPRAVAFKPNALNIGNIVSDTQQRMIRGEEPAAQSAGYFRQMMNLRDRWQDRARFVGRLAFTPSVGEWQAVSLPDRLFPIYRVVRVWRLANRAWRIISRFRMADQE